MTAQLRFKPGGVSQYFEGPNFTGKLIEVGSSTCSHCRHLTDVESRKRMMEVVDICRGCMKLICLSCHGKPCIPFEKRAERIEELHRLQSRVHMQAWRCY